MNPRFNRAGLAETSQDKVVGEKERLTNAEKEQVADLLYRVATLVRAELIKAAGGLHDNGTPKKRIREGVAMLKEELQGELCRQVGPLVQTEHEKLREALVASVVNAIMFSTDNPMDGLTTKETRAIFELLLPVTTPENPGKVSHGVVLAPRRQ